MPDKSRERMVDENWAIFVEKDEVKWYFGIQDPEFHNVVLNFITGLANLGKDLFGEQGIASINFDLRKHSGLKASEIFIVSLFDQFFLLISDPTTTLRLITSQGEGGIPKNIKEIMTAVLVGQASVLYGASIAEADPKERKKINKKYRDIILDINTKYYDNDLIHTIVGKSGSNFSILTFEECLLLHCYLRKQAEQRDYIPVSNWCLISYLDGGEVPFSFNIEDEILYGGYFAAIIGFISTLFESKPKSIVFGTTKIRKLRFVYGKKYFMAIDTSFMIDLLLKRQFQQQFYDTRYEIMKDLALGIKKLIIEEILQFNEEKLNKLSAETLLDTYIDEGSEDLKLFFGNGKENIELLREEHRNQILRVWGRFLVDL
jgi:hypothetical protein